MASFRTPFLRTSRIYSRCLRRSYSSPPPTYPANNPIHVSPAILGQRSQLSTFLRFCLASASIGLPAYWILWLGQKVSIPYYVGRLDAFQTKLTEEQKQKLAKKLMETAMEELVLELKESIGLPFRVDQMPGAFTIRTPKIDPSRVIYRLDISREGISRSQKTFNPADISSWYVSKDVLPDATSEGEVGYKSLDDVREGYVIMEGMVKVTGPRELGGRMGTVEFSGIINVETTEIVHIRKAQLRVMGKKISD